MLFSLIFTDSAPRPIQSTIRTVRFFFCVCRVSWRLLVKGHITNIGLQSHTFKFLSCVGLFLFYFCILSQLLWIMEELAGEGLWLWLLALVTNGRWQVTWDIRHVTCDTENVRHDMWHVIRDIWFVTHGTLRFVLPKKANWAQEVPNGQKSS